MISVEYLQRRDGFSLSLLATCLRSLRFTAHLPSMIFLLIGLNKVKHFHVDHVIDLACSCFCDHVIQQLFVYRTGSLVRHSRPMLERPCHCFRRACSFSRCVFVSRDPHPLSSLVILFLARKGCRTHRVSSLQVVVS